MKSWSRHQIVCMSHNSMHLTTYYQRMLFSNIFSYLMDYIAGIVTCIFVSSFLILGPLFSWWFIEESVLWSFRCISCYIPVYCCYGFLSIWTLHSHRCTCFVVLYGHIVSVMFILAHRVPYHLLLYFTWFFIFLCYVQMLQRNMMSTRDSNWNWVWKYTY